MRNILIFVSLGIHNVIRHWLFDIVISMFRLNKNYIYTYLSLAIIVIANLLYLLIYIAIHERHCGNILLCNMSLYNVLS